jgi:SNF2 family DNA or RNA helicase
MINARHHQGTICVRVGREGIIADVTRALRGKWVGAEGWKCIVAPWTSFNCAKTLELAHRFGWSGSDPEALAEIERMGWPVIIKEPALFPYVKTAPNVCMLDQAGEETLRALEETYLARPLWKHQRSAFKTLYRLNGAILDMGMGTGKSMTTIALIGSGKHDFGMIVCPKSVIDVWPLEFERNCKKQFHIFSGTGKRNQSIQKYVTHLARSWHDARVYNRPFVFVCNYEAMWQGALKEFIENNKFDYIVFDEVHRLKAPSGTASKFAAKLRKSALRIFGCSGTLLPHSPMDAFGTFRAVDPTVFGPHFIPFRKTFADMGGFEGKQIVRYKREDFMHQLISSISFRVKTEDALDLPDAVHITRKCKLEPATLKIYKDMASEMFAEFEGNELTAANALVKVVRLMQITSGVVKDSSGDSHRIGNEKATLFAETLEDIDMREPVIVFCRFTADIAAAKEAAIAQGRTVSELSGKKNELKAWQQGETDVLVVQIQAGKEGVDFTRACICFYYSMTHSLGDYEQSLRRPHRPGQTRSVRYFHLVAEGTVDEDIYAGLEKKKSIVLSVLEGVIREKYKERGQENSAMAQDAIRMAMRIAGV